MTREYLRINKFGFAEYQDMEEISKVADMAELASTLQSVVQIVLLDEPGLLDTLSDEAQADFVVPLGMASRLLSSGDYSATELISAACTVRYCGEPHMSEFPIRLASLISQLPR